MKNQRLALALWLLVPAVATAQQATVTGRVTDATTNRPIGSARIQVVGTTISVMTDTDGRYVIQSVPAGTHDLRAQLVGYNSITSRITTRAGQAATADFTLRPAVISMDEVVVTGTAGEARRREIGNTITQISIQQVENQPVTSLGDVLQGRAAGLTIMDNSGQIGAGQTIRLRGIKSVTQGNTPLMYIDGVRVANTAYESMDETSQAGSPLLDMNPQDIERIEIIKGAAATTLYGTEASSGVIQVFTKRGSQGAPVWAVQMEQGFHRMGHIGPRENNPSGLNMNDCTAFPGCPTSGSWFRDAHLQRYTASVRGGQGGMTYFLSGNFNHEQGVVEPTGWRRWGVRGNFGFTPSEALSITFNNSFSQQRTRWFPDGNNLEGLTLNVMRGSFGYTPLNDNSVIMDMLIWSNTHHFTSGATIGWTPMAGISHRINTGLDFAQSDNTVDHPYGYWNVPLGRRENEHREVRTMTFDYAGTWEAKLGSSISSSFSWGGQLYTEQVFRLEGVGVDFPAPGDKIVNNAAQTNAFEQRLNVTNGGFFFQQVFGLNDRFFITGGVRVDGHSSFGEDFGLAPYPKLSAAYTISDHGFWPDWWEQMKVRAAYGESGKAPGIFDAARTWAPVAGDDARPAVTPDNLGNPDLGPERTREFEVGFEGTAFDSRVAAEVTQYWQKTYDALIDVQQTPSNGFGNSDQLVNVGEVKNWGFETNLNFAVLRGRSLGWDVAIRYSHNLSEAVNLGDVAQIGVGASQEIVLGKPVPSYFKDSIINGAELAEPDFEEVYVGPVYPTDQWGLSTTITLGNRLTIDALGEAQLGHWLYSGVALQNSRRPGTWPLCQEADAARAARALGDSSAYNALTAHDRGRCAGPSTPGGAWVTPADFFKLRQIAVGYNLPPSILPFGVRSAQFRIQGRNLMKVTGFHGLDPESIEGGSIEGLSRREYYNLPAPRTFVASLKIEF